MRSNHLLLVSCDHSSIFIHFVPPFTLVLLCMTVTADRQQVGKAERNRRIINVLRCDVDDMVDCISGSVEPAPETDLA